MSDVAIAVAFADDGASAPAQRYLTFLRAAFPALLCALLVALELREMATALPSKPASLSRANAPQTRGLWSTACFPPSCSHRIHGAPAVHHPEHLDMSGSQRRSSSTLTSPLRPPRTASSWRTAAFEPSAPGAAQIASMATVLASTLATGLYWW